MARSYYKPTTNKTKQTIQNTLLGCKFLFRTICFSIFNPHLIYIKSGAKKKTLFKNSRKAIQIISFKHKNYPTNELYCNHKILKIVDYIKLLSCIFIKNILLNNHLSIFETFFKKASETHSYSTRHATTNLVFLPQPQTDQYGKFFITYQTASTWNELYQLGINMLESNSKLKTASLQLYFNNYLN